MNIYCFRYEPKTSRLRAILERCQNPSDETRRQSISYDNVQLFNDNAKPIPSNEETFSRKSLPKHSFQEMVNEINRRDYSLTSNLFHSFNEHNTTQSK